MLDVSWLATEAQKLHSIFQNAFFVMLSAFLLLAVIMEFFKMPLGESPGFTTLLSRCLFATLILIALPEIMNFIGDATDSIVQEIGSLNQFKVVLDRMGDRLRELSWSWTSVKDMVLLVVSFLSFFILYITVYFSDAAYLYCWTLIYVFSPLVLALYVFPATAGATSALFKSMIEVSLWKVCWSVMSTLLWSTALSDINRDPNITFLTALVLNLMLALSVLLTPMVVRSLLTTGTAALSSSLQNMVMAGAALTPTSVVTKSVVAASLPVMSAKNKFSGSPKTNPQSKNKS